MAITQINGTDTLDQWRAKTQTISTNMGALATLTTSASNLVGAVNELDNEQGTLSSLATTNKGNLVAAINELNTDINNLSGLSAIERPVLVALA